MVPAGTPASPRGLAYLGFGIWALAISSLNPFYLVFIVPALMLLAGSSGTTAR